MEIKYQNIGTYITEDHHSYVKESFKKLEKLVQPDKNKKVLDIGCATGALISYLKSCHSEWEFTGVDVSDELLNIAKIKVPGVNFINQSGINLSEDYTDQFDLVTCIGVLGIFDEKDAMMLLNELVRCTKPGGEIILFNEFNELDVDRQVTHRKYNKDGQTIGWEKAWNNYSIKTINLWLKDKVNSLKFIDWHMPIPLTPKDDLVRSWTIEVENKLRLTNGLKLFIDLKFLKIKV